MFKKLRLTAGQMTLGLAFVFSVASPLNVSFAQTSGNSSNGSSNETTPPSNACKLPVCDIIARIGELEKGTQNDRFLFVSGLRKQFKKSKDETEWNNLLTAGEEVRELSIRVQDEDWMVDEAQNLINEAVIALMKFRRPVETSYLMEMFKRLPNENQRSQALEHWKKQAKTLTDRDALSALLKFGNQAQKLTIQLEDEEWVSRAALEVANLATAALVALDPAHEGTYAIEPLCSPNECGNYPEMKTMVVIETRGGYGLAITFPMSFGGTPAYSFYSAAFTDGPDQVVASSTPAGSTSPRPAELKVSFNRVTGEVTGVIRDTRSTRSWKFKGTPIRRVLTVADQPTQGTAPAISEIPGIYEADVAGTPSKFVIRETMDGSLFASLVNDNYILDFKIGNYIPTKSFISFVYVGANQNMVKAGLKLRKVGGTIEAEGFSYSSRNGQAVNWKAKRISAVDDE